MHRIETQNVEFKEQWSDDALKTICAFANTDGGMFYIGINDKGKSVELKDTKRLLEDIPNKIKDILGIIADVKTIKKAGKPVIRITVTKYTAPISYKGKFYTRSGSTTSEFKGIELSRFLLSRSGTSWDNITEPRASFKDISVKTIRHFQQLAQKRFPFIAREKNMRLFLQKLNLAEKGRLKRAAVLVFGKNPKKYFTSAFIQIGRFASESEVISTDVIEGNLFEQVEKTMEILRLKYLENRFYYEGIYRKEDLVYPEDALREAVINAVIHRDYMGPHIQLRVYDDKLCLWNIGKLPPEITCDSLKRPHSSYPRNELLADIFFKAGFIESWGRGTIKIIERCQQANLREPEFSEMTGGLQITFFKAKKSVIPVGRQGKGVDRVGEKVGDRVGEKITENQLKIIEAIQKDSYVSAQALSKYVGISQRKIEENIAKLKAKGILNRIGPDRGGYWEVVK